MIKVKRVYEPPSQEDGYRVLVDRFWPRGMSKQKARVDLWLRDIAPSDELRRWYNHEPLKWDEFRNRYFAEIKERGGLPEFLEEKIRTGPVTLLFSSTELRLNNAVALKEYLENMIEVENETGRD